MTNMNELLWFWLGGLALVLAAYPSLKRSGTKLPPLWAVLLIALAWMPAAVWLLLKPAMRGGSSTENVA